MMQDIQSPPEICDYEGATYRTDFWEGKGRDYEDRVERLALRRLLPQRGERLLEIGAGFGRLTQEYNAYNQVVLLDYSLSQLQYAQAHLGTSGRYVYVAANAYKLPFQQGVFDGATLIRVIHHFVDAPAVLAQIRHALTPDATFILEFANKRNLKAVIRYALKQQTWNPHALEPVEFAALNFDFHPQYIEHALFDAGFATGERIPVSFFRVAVLKRLVPTGLLVGMDNILQRSGLLYAPSIFVRSRATGDTPNHLDTDDIFACPECGKPLTRRREALYCEHDDLHWAIRDGIYDFKAPLEQS
ncbi:MAG: methyltransferase domain-containing protein [Chloroflexi bacterium]|nr:MAG: methyltransferase domain-containing protein [Chloroflexota bacterium]